MRTWSLAAALAVSAACTDGGDKPSDTEADSGGTTSCESLEEEDCIADADCEPIFGRAISWIDKAEVCYEIGDEEFFECYPADQDCAAVISYLSPSGDDCYEFGGCTPTGWTECSLNPAEYAECG